MPAPVCHSHGMCASHSCGKCMLRHATSSYDSKPGACYDSKPGNAPESRPLSETGILFCSKSVPPVSSQRAKGATRAATATAEPELLPASQVRHLNEAFLHLHHLRQSIQSLAGSTLYGHMRMQAHLCTCAAEVLVSQMWSQEFFDLKPTSLLRKLAA